MSQNRREFIERVTAGAMLATIPLSGDAIRAFATGGTRPVAEEWDLSWASKLNGKYKAVFDVAEIESGYGVWRASIWAKQYMDVLKAAPSDLSSVVVIRHNAIVLAMTQAFWDTYGVAKSRTVTHPVTEQPTDRNPVLLSSSHGEVPAQLDDVALDKYLARGGIALACNLAFDDVVSIVSKKDGGSPESARKTALDGLVKGVILQPSGVFAALHAQDIGCKFLRSS